MCFHEQSTLVKCLRARGIDLQERLSHRIQKEKERGRGSGKFEVEPQQQAVMTTADYMEASEQRPRNDRHFVKVPQMTSSVAGGAATGEAGGTLVRRQYPPHLCVLKSIAWNSNQIPVNRAGAIVTAGATATAGAGPDAYGSSINGGDRARTTTDVCTGFASSSSAGAQFIFHAVGSWNKMQVMCDVITSKANVLWPHMELSSSHHSAGNVFRKLEEFKSVAHSFRLVRGLGSDIQSHKNIKNKKEEYSNFNSITVNNNSLCRI